MNLPTRVNTCWSVFPSRNKNLFSSDASENPGSNFSTLENRTSLSRKYSDQWIRKCVSSPKFRRHCRFDHKFRLLALNIDHAQLQEYANWFLAEPRPLTTYHQFLVYSLCYGTTRHMIKAIHITHSWYSHDVCKLSLWSVVLTLNYSTTNFDRILNSIEIPLLGCGLQLASKLAFTKRHRSSKRYVHRNRWVWQNWARVWHFSQS